MLAVVLVQPGVGFEQAASAPADELIHTIESIAERAPDASRSAELIDPLQTLALRYQENGSHERAVAVIERALDVVRVNYGLHSLEQAPLIQLSIDNEAARNNRVAVWALEQDLLILAERNPDDLRTVPILRQIAASRMDTRRRYIAGEYIPEIVVGCYYRYRRSNAPPEGCSSGSMGVAAGNLLLEAQKHYEDAIEVLLRHELYSSDELRELEMILIRDNYFYGDEGFPVSRYEKGKERFGRLIDYGVKNSDLLSQIESLVQIADWELMYANNALAHETYEQAYERLVQEDMPQESIEQLYSPNTPIVLPAFLPNPLVSEDTPQSTGFIDVAFTITRYGKSRQIEILDTTTNASKDARKDLIRLISLSRFRPRTENGRFDRRSPVVVRYYVNE
jgi:hypothetical protein